MVITSGEMAEKAKEQLTQTSGQHQLLGKEICDTVIGNQVRGLSQNFCPGFQLQGCLMLLFKMAYLRCAVFYSLQTFKNKNYRTSSVTQSCPTLCDPMGCSPPDSSVHGTLQTRILQWVTFPPPQNKLHNKTKQTKKTHVCMFKASQVRLLVKNPPANAGRHKRHRFHPWVRKIPWRRAWPFTLAFSPGESHRQRSLVGYNPWGCIESDTTKATQQALTLEQVL